MPFVPLGSWSPCASLVCNQGFRTLLGESSISTNSVKALDIRFLSSQFRKKYLLRKKWSNVRRCSPMAAGDQRLVHMPFVPSVYWSPCAPLVWNQGFPTPLGGLSTSTNPIKERGSE
ncbi:unnamed protein product [Schistosoma curassoni]|uniref:Secreted protein n=1 Tax=Schistosoma curassoni TaxID=6186 RepID=A0A183JXQ1_9TREM|nr:unnamed protein product [Schistosoma curassoni]